MGERQSGQPLSITIITRPRLPKNVNGVLSLDDVRLSGKRVLFRVDVNSPLHPETGAFLDDSRLRGIVPTLRALSDAKVVIISHQSRPGKSDFTNMSGHAERMVRILGRPVRFIPDVCGEVALEAIRSMINGEIIFLDNVRMHPEEMALSRATPEELAKSQIVATLAPEFDAYVTDAFAAAHRNSPSLAGFAEELPCFAGRLMEREISALGLAVTDPPRPYVVILGGAKADDSLRVAINLIERDVVDTVAFVGVVGNMMLWASGIDIGEGNQDFIRNTLGDSFEETWSAARHLLTDHEKLLFLPSDVAVERDGERIPMKVEELPTEDPIYDIGLETLMRLRPLLLDANCILWNGPASYFEKPQFAFGTIEILNICTESAALTIVGGGHTSALVSSRGVSDKISHNSTGGGACLTMLSGARMPVIEALMRSASVFSKSE
ncbi:MAG TPA: phosphoglycerate kinase [Candidatus Poseidoniales archaeon]|nr:MAG: phosphoglycerate kinase [Euryarchaeota archaeon]HIE81457.1 phosphoglycerate kinase [Candidatus Poseidoniales archaeon]HIL50393.1 phosphoglycerate kinase [Candidatus Poseidoniales archaeon]